MCSSGTVYKGEREKYWYLSCQNIPSRSVHKCPHGARIRYDMLLDAVSADLRSALCLTDEQRKTIVEKAVRQELSKSGEEETKKEISAAKSRIKKLEQITTGLYEDMYTGAVPKDRAIAMIHGYEEEAATLQSLIARLSDSAQNACDAKDRYDRFFSLVDAVTGFEKLDRQTLVHFIERIEIGPRRYVDGQPHGPKTTVPFEQDVRIVYRFIGCADFTKDFPSEDPISEGKQAKNYAL